MHPAPSLILFTVLSGLGFGLLVWLGLGLRDVTGVEALVFYALGYGLTGAGLIAAAFHLGHPERALLAFSQWRSSWLSREAVLAAGTLLVMAPHAAGLVFRGTGLPVLGAGAAGLALITVIATAMIYGQLRSVPRWNHWSTPAVFVLAALAGGALILGARSTGMLLLLWLALALLAHWKLGDLRWQGTETTAETATGLGRIGAVRLLAPPHTGANYLLREMVFQVGRRHALRLRWIALGLAALGPLLLLVLVPGWMGALGALTLHVPGMLAARWLFFAEAEHVVGRYYGR
jgi:DMSO reductase anchor subunit